MSDETGRPALRQADQIRTDIANVEISLEMIMAQIVDRLDRPLCTRRIRLCISFYNQRFQLSAKKLGETPT
jgi:hypothetical protein